MTACISARPPPFLPARLPCPYFIQPPLALSSSHSHHIRVVTTDYNTLLLSQAMPRNLWIPATATSARCQEEKACLPRPRRISPRRAHPPPRANPGPTTSQELLSTTTSTTTTTPSTVTTTRRRRRQYHRPRWPQAPRRACRRVAADCQGARYPFRAHRCGRVDRRALTLSRPPSRRAAAVAGAVPRCFR